MKASTSAYQIAPKVIKWKMKSFKIPSKKGIDVIRKGTTDNPLINLETYFDFILLILIILVISTQKNPAQKIVF